MAAVTLCSDFGAQENRICKSIYGSYRLTIIPNIIIISGLDVL